MSEPMDGQPGVLERDDRRGEHSTSRAWFFSVVMKAGRTKTNAVNLGITAP